VSPNVLLIIQSLFLARHINVPEKIDSGECPYFPS
jgi:hypothetical protein